MTITIVLSACSANREAGPSGGGNPVNAAANTANANSPAAVNSASRSEMVPYNGVQNINPNAFNASSDNLKVIPNQPKKDELPYGTRPAPDDSVVSSGSRGTDFIETRMFRNHAQLAKVEKIMNGRNTKYKVFLKNGKVLEAPADKMNNFTAIAPENILDAVGLLPKTPAAPEVKKEEKSQ